MPDSPIRCALLTVSDRSSAGVRPDLSGPALVETVTLAGWMVVSTGLLPDDFEAIKRFLIEKCDSGSVDIILTTGGTGFSPRDVTPEATLAIIEKNAPGLSEAMRSESKLKNPHSLLSRGITGIRKHTLIINLPGNPNAAVENLETIMPVIPHAVSLLNESPHSEEEHQFRSKG
jgi:molybdenum cofactor synthesis domain-containing protein